MSQHICGLTEKETVTQERGRRSKSLQERRGQPGPQGEVAEDRRADLGSGQAGGQEDGDVLFQVLMFPQ